MSVEIKVTADTRKASEDIDRLRGLLKKVQDEAAKGSKKTKILDVDADQQKINGINKSIQNLNAKLKQSPRYKVFDERSLSTAISQTGQINKNIDSINSSATKLGNTLKSTFAVAAVGVFGTSLLKTAQQFDGIRTRLAIATGSIVKSQKAFSDIQQFAAETKFSVDALADSYARLANTGSTLFSSNRQVLDSLEGIANAVTAVGGGDYEIQRVTEAFSRMASEGRVTYERLEPLVTIGIPLQRIAKEAGKSWAEWSATMERGNLTFDEVFKAFNKLAFSTQGYGGVARKQVNTLSGSFSNLGDAIKNLQDVIVNSTGLKTVIINVVNSITKGIQKLAKFIQYDLTTSIIDFKIFVLGLTGSLNIVNRSINQFVQNSKKIDLSNFVPNIPDFKLDLDSYMPRLNTVKQKIDDFGKFVIAVFFKIYDVVVGNSYWPDTIMGIANWANKLYGMATPGITKFSSYVVDVFSDIKNAFDMWKEKIQIEVKIIQDVGALKYIENLFDDIVAAIKRLGNSGLEAAASGINYSLDLIGDSIKKLAQFSKSGAGKVFNEFTNAMTKLLGVFLPGLGEMPLLAAKLQAALAKMDESQFDVSFQNFKLDIQQKFNNISTRTLEQNLALVIENTVELFQKGIANTDLARTAFSSLGETFGRISARALRDDIKTTFQEDLQDIIIAAFLVAFNKGFRQIAVATLIFKIAFGEDASFVDGLNSLKKHITDFGNSILNGLGLEGFAPSSGGFIVGLLFGTAALAIASGKMTSLIGIVAKELANYFILSKIFNKDNTSAATPGAKAAGSTLGKVFQGAFAVAAGLAALFIGSHIGDAIAESLDVENTFYHLGITAGAIFMTGWAISAGAGAFSAWATITAGPAIILALKRLALAAVFSASMFPAGAAVLSAMGGILAAITAFFTLPVLLGALGIAAGSSLLYYALFGNKDAKGIEGKITRLAYFLGDKFKEVSFFIGDAFGAVFDSIGKGLRDAADYVVGKFSDLKNFFTEKSFRPAGSTPVKPTVTELNPQQRRASGGRISGPGTGKSDSIMARLSNGEFVVNAKATSENLPLLQKLNSGLPGFNSGGLIDLDFLRREENGPSALPKTYGYVPPKGVSGVTIATGLDLGQQSLTSLSDMGIPNNLVTKLKPYIGKKRKSAVNALLNKPLSISDAEAALIEQRSVDYYINLTKNQFKNISSSVNGQSFESLPKPVRTALVSTLFQTGNITRGNSKLAATAAAKGDYKQAAHYYDVWAKYSEYKGRRSREADLFRNAISNKILDENQQLPSKEKLDTIKKDNENIFDRLFKSFTSVSSKTDNVLLMDKLPQASNSEIDALLSRLQNSDIGGGKNLSIRKDKIQSAISDKIGKPALINAGDPMALLQEAQSKYKAKTIIGRILGLPKYAEGTEEPINSPPENYGLKIADFKGNNFITNRNFAKELTPGEQQIVKSAELNKQLITYLKNSVKADVSNYFGENQDYISTSQAISKGALEGASFDLAGGKLRAKVSKNGLRLNYTKAFANGGQIIGEGTGKSDSILARLSNGEFVVNAKATKEHLPLLQSMNSGVLPGFAGGTKGPIGEVFSQIDPKKQVQELTVGNVKVKLDLTDFLNTISDIKDSNLSLSKNTDALAKSLKSSLATIETADFVTRLGFKNAPIGTLKESLEKPDAIKELEDFYNNKLKPSGFRRGVKGLSSSEFSTLKELTLALIPETKDLQTKDLDTQLRSKLSSNSDVTKAIADSFRQLRSLENIQKSGVDVDDQVKEIIDRLKGEIVKAAPEVSSNIKAGNFSAKSITEGTEQSRAYIEDFKSGFSEFLKGKKTGKEFGTYLADQFTSRVVDSFAKSLTDEIFSTSNFIELFAAPTEFGTRLGGLIDKPKVEDVQAPPVDESLFSLGGITGLLGGNKAGTSPLKPLYTKEVPGVKDLNSLTGGSSGGIFGNLFSGASQLFSKGLTSFGSLFTSGGNIASVLGMPGFADGGVIPGAMGSATPVLAHAGEIVLNEAQQARVAAAMTNQSQQVVNVNITGDISRQTKSEIYKMLPSIAEGVNSHNREKGLR